MIFAAGLGTRLKPLTDTMPKALVPVDGHPLIEIVSRKLHQAGFDSAVVNVHHFADRIEDWCRRQDWMDFQISDERGMLLETGGAVLHARKLLEGCGNFLIHNVDVLTNADLRSFASAHRPDALATLLVSPRKTSRYFLFRPDTMRLAGWTNTNTGETVMSDITIAKEDCLALGFSGIHILSDRVFPLMEQYVIDKGLVTDSSTGPSSAASALVPDSLPCSSSAASALVPDSLPSARFSIRDFYLAVAARHPIYGVNVESFRMLDVGKPDALARAADFLASCHSNCTRD